MGHASDSTERVSSAEESDSRVLQYFKVGQSHAASPLSQYFGVAPCTEYDGLGTACGVLSGTFSGSRVTRAAQESPRVVETPDLQVRPVAVAQIYCQTLRAGLIHEQQKYPLT